MGMAKAKEFKPPDPIVGINWKGPKAYAFCNDVKWDIKPLAATKNTVDAVMSVFDDHVKRINDLGDMPPAATVHNIEQDTTCAVLEMTLIDFTYEDAANNPDTPPGLLASLATEMRDFLAAGGRLGMQHALTRLNLARQTS